MKNETVEMKINAMRIEVGKTYYHACVVGGNVRLDAVEIVDIDGDKIWFIRPGMPEGWNSAFSFKARFCETAIDAIDKYIRLTMLDLEPEIKNLIIAGVEKMRLEDGN